MGKSHTSWLKGTVTIEVRGGSPEAFINEAMAGGVKLERLRRPSLELLQADISVTDFFRIKPFLKRTGCKIKVVNRSGMPFFLARAEKRIWFTAGLGLFFVMLFLLASLVWKVEVTGNVRLTEEEILTAARKEGIYFWQISYKLDDMNQISKRLAAALPGTNWVGVEKKGTKINIQVVEQTIPKPLPLNSPRHLIASADAVVTQIVADAGKPMAAKNKKVKKGDVLISGIIGSEGNTRAIPAKGIVRGAVWYEYLLEAPLTHKMKVYTGNKKVSWHLVLGSRALKLSGFGQEPYSSSESLVDEERVGWRNWTLPIGRLKHTEMETMELERILTIEEAKNAAILQAKADVLEKAGLDAIIEDEIVLHEKTDNGKVYMKVLFEVDQSIVKEMPLVHMQGD